MIDESKYATIAHAAKVAGAARTTFDSAVRRGDEPLEIVELACGTTLVSLASAKRWAKRTRKVGRPKAVASE